MSARLKTLAARFAQAKAQADASNARLRRASAARLAEILADPDPARQLAGLRDRALTPFDRAQLQRALTEKLPGRRRRLPLSLCQQLAALLRQLRYRRRALTRAAVLATPLLAAAVLADRHTPTGRPVRLREGFIISWRLPDGSIHQEQEAANTRLVLLHTSDGGFALRRWFPRLGYGEVAVEPAFIERSLSAAE
ncbi:MULTISPECIES: hypothetical protein [Methylobacterium]|jgi:hypothetical protein|uniref:Uncharacterized protein n=1 Tax=Methylobacterium brachiatum TaxID=269660 RepID=A0AAJ1WYS7_9HYPH|nr:MULTISPECIES: hypothetical protein [Methylobacterium]EIZ84324.1 hypothetical protein WYO_3205 [Methylobacterium sp. GXF4]MBP28087.1 hypothetical protein [Methylobacterium sp.]MDH2312537.1 hypothetical protein [Methylobacterium brachiatum]MDQ0546807.1 hypothetical protein [Methylobacterium brachiatum]